MGLAVKSCFSSIKAACMERDAKNIIGAVRLELDPKSSVSLEAWFSRQARQFFFL